MQPTGVLVYEMAMASTPFASKRPDNVTELFTNIAMVTVSSFIVFVSCLVLHLYMYMHMCMCNSHKCNLHLSRE